MLPWGGPLSFSSAEVHRHDPSTGDEDGILIVVINDPSFKDSSFRGLDYAGVVGRPVDKEAVEVEQEGGPSAWKRRKTTSDRKAEQVSGWTEAGRYGQSGATAGALQLVGGLFRPDGKQRSTRCQDPSAPVAGRER